MERPVSGSDGRGGHGCAMRDAPGSAVRGVHHANDELKYSVALAREEAGRQRVNDFAEGRIVGVDDGSDDGCVEGNREGCEVGI